MTHKSYSRAFCQGWHEHDSATIDFVLAGGGAGTYHRDEVVSVGGAVEFFAAGIRHRFASGPTGIRSMHLVMPAALPREFGIDTDTLVRELDASTALDPAMALLDELMRPDGDELALESAAMNLLDRVAACAWPRDEGRWLGDVREMLIDAPALAGSLADIAAAVGRHPSHVAREFRRVHGMTVGQFGRRVRCSRAGRQLADRAGGSISHVAHDHDFSDQAHFTRAFRGHAGRTPARFRETLAQPPAA